MYSGRKSTKPTASNSYTAGRECMPQCAKLRRKKLKTRSHTKMPPSAACQTQPRNRFQQKPYPHTPKSAIKVMGRSSHSTHVYLCFKDIQNTNDNSPERNTA